MSKLNLIYDEEMYNNDYKSYYKRNDVTKICRGLGSATNIQQGLKQVSEIAGDTTGASVILFTDGGANRYDNGEIGGYYYIKNKENDVKNVHPLYIEIFIDDFI